MLHRASSCALTYSCKSPLNSYSRCHLSRVHARPVTLMTGLQAEPGMRSFSERLRAKELLLGTIVTLDSPSVTELLAAAGGFDWLFIDCEHAPLQARLPDVLRAAGGCPCLVRIPELTESAVKHVLDLGATGVIAPQVRWCKYSPEGQRGVGIGRAHMYGMHFKEYLERANKDTVVVAQIEHKDAVAAIDDIAAVPGIDALFIGPYDLSSSLGMLGQLQHDDVRKAVDTVVASTLRSGKVLGAFSMQPSDLQPLRTAGATLVGVGIDGVLLGTAAKALSDAVHAPPAHETGPKDDATASEVPEALLKQCQALSPAQKAKLVVKLQQ